MLLLFLSHFAINRSRLMNRNTIGCFSRSRNFLTIVSSVDKNKPKLVCARFKKLYPHQALPVKQHCCSFYVGMFRTPDYYSRDKVDKNKYRLVYQSPAENYVIYAQLTVDTTCLIAIASVLYHIYEFLSGKEVKLAYGMLKTNAEGLLSYFAFIAFNYAILTVCQRIAVRIYYCEDRDDFIIVFKTLLNPFSHKKLKCKAGDMKCKAGNPDTGLYGISSQYLIGKQKVTLNEMHFIYPLYYNKLLGIGKEYENKQ